MTTKRNRTSWIAGQSGNVAGRPTGSSDVGKLRAAIAMHVPSIVEQLTSAALRGDVGAARLLLERVIPPLKAAEERATLALPQGTLTEQGRAVLGAVAAGELAPGQGSALLAAIGTLARVVEVDELERRICLLEAAAEERGEP